jgi:hypothetical protein
LRLDDHLSHHAPANLHGDDPYLVQMRDARMGDQKMTDDQKMRMRDDWMGAMNYREVFYHPFRTPLFRFVFDAL